MKRVKLSLNYKGLDHSGKKVYANLILTNLTGNANYPNPSPSLAVLQTAIADLDAAINASKPNIITINSKEVFLEKVLYALKAHVELECNEDEDKAVSSGFELRQGGGTKPKVFSAKQGKLSGGVDLECAYQKNAAYVWEYINDPINQNTWVQFKVTNNTNTTLSNLIVGNKYWFRVKAIVKDEEQTYTDPHMVHVV
jgi:hypothetical protein